MNIQLIQDIITTIALAVALIVAVFFTVKIGIQQTDAAHEQRIEVVETVKPIVADESDAHLHAPEPHTFPDPCGLESVVCEGEEGWTAE